MVYPNVTLKIENYMPSIELHSDVDAVRTVVKADKGIDTVLLETATALGVDWDIAEIMQRVHAADETLIQFPEIVFESEKLDLAAIENAVQQAISEYVSPADLDAELTAEINANWYADVLASYLNQIYNLLIARTVFIASEMGIGDIQLIDSHNDARLREKMSRDLESIDLELLVDAHGTPTE